MVTSFAAERVPAERPLGRRAVAGLLAAIVLPIPLVSAYGLTLPLPGFVGRMAFALVPGTGAEQSAASASPRGVTIARLPGEKVSEATNPAAVAVTFDGRAAVIGTHRPLWAPLSSAIASSTPAAGATVDSATTTAFHGGAPPDGDTPAPGGSTAVTPTAGTSVVTPRTGAGTGSTSPGAGSNGGGLTRVPDDTVDGTSVPTPVGDTPVDPSGTTTTPTTDPSPTVTTDPVPTVTDAVTTVTDAVTTVTDTVPTVTDTVTTVTDTVATVTDTVTTVTSGTLGGLLPPGSGTHRKKT